MSKPPRRFWTSDQHIGHNMVAVRHRGFKTVEEHDKTLAEAWDRVVRPNDIVYVLGDISISPRRDGAFKWFRERPGIKHLVSGNHDAVHPMHGARALREQRRAIQTVVDDHDVTVSPLSWYDSFESINSMATTTINGRKIMLSHFPYRGEGNRDLEERYSEYRLRDEGFPILHGHTHSNRKISTLTGGGGIHVGVDAWDWTPVSEAQVSEKLALIDRFHKAKQGGSA